MDKKVFPIKIKKIKNGFEASLIDFPDCKVVGKTVADAYADVKYKMNEHVLDSILNNTDMPTPSTIEDDELTAFIVVDVGDNKKAKKRLAELTNPKLRIKNKISSIIFAFLIFALATNVVEFAWNNIIIRLIETQSIGSYESLVITAILNIVLIPFFIIIARKE